MLLSATADFGWLDGKLQANFDVRSSGQSQQAIMSGLAGTASANFKDGAIRGLNVAQMIRSLTTSKLSGWQDNEAHNTDLSQLSASFRIDKGQAVTTDLNLVGPLVRITGAGTLALDTKMMGFRVEPKLVMTTEGQGRAAEPVGRKFLQRDEDGGLDRLGNSVAMSPERRRLVRHEFRNHNVRRWSGEGRLPGQHFVRHYA